jgi:hypothetical protein
MFTLMSKFNWKKMGDIEDSRPPTSGSRISNNEAMKRAFYLTVNVQVNTGPAHNER